MRTRALVVLLVVLATPTSTSAQGRKATKPKPWPAFEGGLTVKTRDAAFFTTLAAVELQKMVARIGELRRFYESHFGQKLKKGWRIVVLKDRPQFTKYQREVTKGRAGVQGQCFAEQKVVTVCDHSRYGWNATLSHEYAHAYYKCLGPIWLREGIASLVEVAVGTGQGKQRKLKIPVNPPRLRGLRLYQGRKHYLSIKHLIRGEKEPDGYGYSYEHGWSFHYYLFNKNPKRYRAFLKTVRKRRGKDLSGELEKAFGLDVDGLDAEWTAFTKKLEAPR
ncbi:MAG: hypothetical protein CMJ83_08635 [Planctomycetes bacterium]|nr:hypothetical protein [Planctomycetota bacterium]